MKKVLSLMMVLVLVVGLLVGCGGDDKKAKDEAGNNTTNNSVATPSGDSPNVDGIVSTADVNFKTGDNSTYRIVRPEGDTNATSVAQYIFKQMRDKLGVNARNVSDTEDGTDAYEILVGMTNREESKKAAQYLEGKAGGRYSDYVICTIGKKICIYSKNPEILKPAAEAFVADYLKAEPIKGGINAVKASEGNFESIKVNGVEVGKFNFVRPHFNSSWLTECEMEEIVDTVYNKTGYMMSINHDTQSSPEDYEIIVGNTTREGVEAVTDYDQYKITVKGKKVYINGGSAHATAMGVSEFSKMLTGEITDASSVVGSYNTAMASYDKSKEYYWTWGDDFDLPELDLTKWGQEKESNQSPGQNGKTSVRSSDPNDVFVSDGKFYICARQDDHYYYGGMIRTQRTMEYKYGYAEMSSVIPQGDSFWIAWWACSNDAVSSVDPSAPKLLSPEIDIVECFGNSKYYAANCHSWPTTTGTNEYGYVHTSLDGTTYGEAKKYTLEDEGKVLGNDFHTYGFLWDNTKMGFTCDGDLYFVYDTTKTYEDIECFNHSMYFIYSMALGFADAPGNPITEDPVEWSETNKLILDWMHLYQKDDGLHELNWMGAK